MIEIKISSIFLKQHAKLIGIESNFQVLTEDDQKRLIKNSDKDKRLVATIFESFSTILKLSNASL